MKNVPKLRFKEFSGEWEKRKLQDFVDYVKGFAFRSDDYQDVGVRIIRVSDLGSSSIKESGDKVFIDQSLLSNFKKYIINRSDIIITTVGSKPELIDSAVGRGILVKIDNEGLLNQNLLKINNSYKCNNVFLFGYINSYKYKNHIKNIQRGNANQSNIALSDLFEYIVYLPTLPEQTKIATFLTAIDDRITQLTQKVNGLEQYKKAVMQQIFSQKLRFKDENGRAFESWEEKRLADVAKINPKANFLPNEFIYIDLESVEKGVIIKEKFITKNESPSRAQRLLSKGDILFQLVRPYQGNNLFFNKDGIYVASTGYAQIRTNQNPNFIYYCLHLNDFNIEVMSRCTGTGYPSINSNDLADIVIKIPSPPEQEKIAGFLAAVDDKIAVAKAKLEAVRQYKQGLLQQMFI